MPTDRERIEEWSWGYWALKYYQNILFRLYFKTEIVGLEKLPPNTTLIFAPNHQNALIDALAIQVLFEKGQPIFLARADIFNNPKISKFLTFLKIMPVYRIRDGYENLSLNDKIFKKTMDIIRNHNGLVILPEGNHAGYKRLRQLKKGIARISLQTEDAADGTLNIKIVPIGLEYSNYVRYHSKLLIRVGEPFEVKKYLELYRQNQAQAYNSLIGELEEKMKSEMIHIEDEENYDAYLTLHNLFSPQYINNKKLPRTQNQRFLIDKKIVSQLDILKQNNELAFNSIVEKAKEYGSLLSSNNICQKAIPLSAKKTALLPINAAVLLMLLPAFLYGAINNMLIIFGAYRVSKLFKDVQFLSSVRHSVTIVLLPLVYLIQTLIFGLIVKDGLLTLAYLLSIPTSAVVVYHWRFHFIKFINAIKLLKFIKTKPDEAVKINNLQKELYETVEKLIA